MTEPFENSRHSSDKDWEPQNNPDRFDSDPLAELARLIEQDPFADMVKEDEAVSRKAGAPRMTIAAPPVEVEVAAETVAPDVSASNLDRIRQEPVESEATMADADASGDDIDVIAIAAEIEGEHPARIDASPAPDIAAQPSQMSADMSPEAVSDMLIAELENSFEDGDWQAPGAGHGQATAFQGHAMPETAITGDDSAMVRDHAVNRDGAAAGHQTIDHADIVDESALDRALHDDMANARGDIDYDPAAAPGVTMAPANISPDLTAQPAIEAASADVDRLFADISAAHSAPIEPSVDEPNFWDLSEQFDQPVASRAGPSFTPPSVAPAINSPSPALEDGGLPGADAYEAMARAPLNDHGPQDGGHDNDEGQGLDIDADPVEASFEAGHADVSADANTGHAGFVDYDPAFDDTGHMLPIDDDDAAMIASHGLEGEPANRRRGLFVVAALLGLAVLGGGVVLAYNAIFGTIESGPPPTLQADGTPAKTVPDDPGGADIPNQNKLVYDRIGGTESETPERVVSREEEVAPDSEAAIRVIGTPVVPSDGLSREGTTAAPVPDQPKRVKTVVVKPDGTVVGEPQPPVTPAPIPVPTARIANVGGDNADSAATSQPAFTPPAAPSQSASQSTPQPRGADASRPESRPLSLTPTNLPAARPETSPTASAVRTVPTRVVTPAPQRPSTRPNDPSQLVSNQARPSVSRQVPAQVANAPAASTAPVRGGYVVQVASRKTPDLAQSAATAIQSRYASSLNGLTTRVDRADLGTRGVFYRVGVGPLNSRQDAAALCGRLKSAGLDCFVRRN